MTTSESVADGDGTAMHPDAGDSGAEPEGASTIGVLPRSSPQAAVHKARYTFLDVARAVAASCVLLQHALEASGIETLDHGAIATTWLNLGETGVATFFLVSGFIIPASMKATPTLMNFWIRRIFRIYPLYITTFFLTIALSVLVFGRPSPPPLRTAISHLFIIQSWIGLPEYVGGSWTLLIEFAWYGCFSIAFFSLLGAGRPLLIIALLIFLAIFGVAAVSFGSFPFGRLAIFSLCFMGYLYYLRFADQMARRESAILIAMFYALIYASLIVGFYVYPSDAHGAPSFSCVMVSWTLALVFLPLLIHQHDSALGRSRFLGRIGEISFSIYLLHSPIMQILQYLGVSGPIFIVETFVLTGLASMVTYKFIERPGIAFARRLTARP